VDVYNKNVYPQDEEAMDMITLPCRLSSFVRDEEYLCLLET
jgi:hypothetical protein